MIGGIFFFFSLKNIYFNKFMERELGYGVHSTAQGFRAKAPHPWVRGMGPDGGILVSLEARKLLG